MIVIALIGAPGAGKTTLAAALSSEGIPRIRVSLASTHSAEAVLSGHLASDEAAIASVLAQLTQALDAPYAAVTLDGFPRTAVQASALLAWAESAACDVRPILLEAPAEILDSRLAARKSADLRPDDALGVGRVRRHEYESRIGSLLLTLSTAAPVRRIVARSTDDVLAAARQEIRARRNGPG